MSNTVTMDPGHDGAGAEAAEAAEAATVTEVAEVAKLIKLAKVAQQPDRRVRRSRRAIREAFMDLTVRMPYREITVEAIVERADVARGTFYAHFDSIEGLFTDVVHELVDDLMTTAEQAAPSEAGSSIEGAALRLACRHIAEHVELYRVILSGAGDGAGRTVYGAAAAGVMSRVFARLCEAHGVQPRINVELVATTWAGSFLGLVDWWLAEEPPRPPDEIAAMAAAFLARGFLWAVSLDGRVGIGPSVFPDPLAAPDAG